ncbi:male accessory gland serine protease inhibitor-like [Drosophila eugracilis]|uniref:male accessory gland serine protease inhibitor-like n=1 Tax=Drosophila eugracilis TaxID=29029 RepID=UPI0007E8AB53|nr:male accessory gland serine protease inhibitor-like [Drosophila eugracilis]
MKLLILVFVFVASVACVMALRNEICGLPHSLDGDLECRISCEAYFPSWSYDSAHNECVKFIYGGCGGNANRFPSKELCEKKCLE